MRIAVQEWLDGGDVTLANCRRAAMAPARKAYEEAQAPAWKAYEEAMARAWKAYNEARAPAFYAAWKLYANAVIGPLTAASAAGEES
jgi:glutathione S-transferase